MFLKTKSTDLRPQTSRKETTPSIITREINILGNIISDGVIDFEGQIDGNIRCNSFTLRANGHVKGEIVADNVSIYGKVTGLIRAKNVQLFATCHIEGTLLHESLAIEDGAFIDGKCKRTDKPLVMDEFDPVYDDSESQLKVLENIRLIR